MSTDERTGLLKECALMVARVTLDHEFDTVGMVLDKGWRTTEMGIVGDCEGTTTFIPFTNICTCFNL